MTVGPPTLRYPGEVRRVRFLERPNRYLAIVLDPELGRVAAHVPNPGRLRELLPETGTFGHIVGLPPDRLRRGHLPERKTAWTLVNVEAPDDPRVLVSVDTGAARPIVDQALLRGDLGPVADWGEWRSEVVWGHHRFDHAVLGAEGKGARPRALLEVKSSNLKEGSTALFPDAPTVRGTSHVEALARFVRGGGRAALLFLVQRDDAREVRPYGAMDAPFARAVERARRAGVLCLGRALHVRPGGAEWGKELPVGPPEWAPASDLRPPVGGGERPPVRAERHPSTTGARSFAPRTTRERST